MSNKDIQLFLIKKIMDLFLEIQQQLYVCVVKCLIIIVALAALLQVALKVLSQIMKLLVERQFFVSKK